jgi:chorismate mutase
VSGRGTTDVAAELARLRGEIDALDRRLVALLSERAELAREIGRLKAVAGEPVADPAREREVLLRVSMANLGPIPQADLLAIYRRLFEATRALEAQDREREADASRGGGGEPTDDDHFDGDGGA